MRKRSAELARGDLGFVGPLSLALMLLLICRDGFECAVVHALRTNIEPMLIKFLVRHVCSHASLFTLQPLFGPLT